LAVAHASAQIRATTGDLRVTVRDETEAVLPAATVIVESTETGLTRMLTTGEDGRAEALGLPPGPYSIRVERGGFAAATAEAVEVALGTVTDIVLTMRIAPFGVETSVEVSAALVDPQKAGVATVVGNRLIADLPIDRRNYISFGAIVPGVSSDRTPNQGPAETSGLTFAGQSARHNNITIDGLDNNDEVVGGVRATFSQDAVREFQVIVNAYSAEFGKASAGFVNIVTKSGTNTLTADAFEFFRDRALNSRGYFDDFDPSGSRVDRGKAPFSQHQFGGTVGGPLVRNRTFGFGSFERLIVDTSSTVAIDDRTLIAHPLAPVVLGTPADILRRAGFPVEVGNVPFSIRSTTGLFKLDHVFGDGEQMMFRVNVADGANGNSQPFGGIVARSRGGLLRNRDYAFAGSLTSLAGRTLFNELRVQVARRSQVVESLDPRCGGPCTGYTQGGPGVEVAGVARLGRHNFTPQPRRTMRYQVLDTVSVDRGRHQLKAGVDVNIIDTSHAALPLNFGGQFVFIDLPAPLAAAFGLPRPISAIQAFALGLPVAYAQGYGEPETASSIQDLSAFVQDDWRLGPRLSLRGGVRFQRQFWPDREYTAVGYPGPYTPRTGRVDLAPRLGVGWDPRGDGRSAVSASYGIFVGNHFNAPFTVSQVVDGRLTRVVVLLGAPAVAAWQSPDHRLPTAALNQFPSATLSVSPTFRAPYTHQAAVSFTQQAAAGMVFSASGIFVRGHRIVSSIDYNPTLPSLGPGRRPADVNGVAGTSASGLQYTPWGESWYRGLVVSASNRSSAGSQLLVSYTLSKAEDTISDFVSFPPQNQGLGRNGADPDGLPLGFDPDAERGPSLQDQRHRFVASGVQELPFGFQVSGVLTVGSGRPFNIIAGTDLNGDGDGTVSPGPDRARAVPSDASTSVGRNAGRLPRETRMDLRLARRIPIGPRASLTATADVLNAFNTTTFIDVNRVFGAGAYPSQPLPTYGQFTQAAPPRQVQLGIRVSF
jgi:hypothetical protein